MIKPEVLKRLKRDSLLFDSSIHGLYHWRTVERNGLYLSDFSGADKSVVSYFAYFHDCMRENDGIDKNHGSRAAKYAKKLRVHLPLDDVQFKTLCIACSGHTHGRKVACQTVATCWDADRLDIGRVGAAPCSKYLFTEEAKRIADNSDFGALYGYSEVEKIKE